MEVVQMTEHEKNAVVTLHKNFNTEFSKEISRFNFNENLHQSAKQEIEKFKEYYDGRL